MIDFYDRANSGLGGTQTPVLARPGTTTRC
jgi:hypothetical protein